MCMYLCISQSDHCIVRDQLRLVCANWISLVLKGLQSAEMYIIFEHFSECDALNGTVSLLCHITCVAVGNNQRYAQ